MLKLKPLYNDMGSQVVSYFSDMDCNSTHLFNEIRELLLIVEVVLLISRKTPPGLLNNVESSKFGFSPTVFFSKKNQ